MPTISLSLPASGTVIAAGLHIANYAALQALLNGNLDGNNISSVPQSKLAFNTWQNWTPTLWQGGNVAITSNLSRYFQLGPLAFVTWSFQVNGTGVASNHIEIRDLPIAISANANAQGISKFTEAGVAHWVGMCYKQNSTTIIHQTDGVGNLLGLTPNFVLGAGDNTQGTIMYEAA